MTALLNRPTIGIPKEIKTHEYRVAVTPKQVQKLVQQGNRVVVGKDAGKGSGYSDMDYMKAGASVYQNTCVYAYSDLIVKVKEPQPIEYEMVRENQVVFTYFHFASSKQLTHAMKESKAVCIAYETVKTPDQRLPLLAPMSEIAGLIAVQQGMKYTERIYDGRGVLVCGSSTSSPGTVVVIGGGTAGKAAATLAARIGANVYILDNNLTKLEQLKHEFHEYSNVHLILSESRDIITEHIAHADIVIGAILVHGAEAPKLITKEMIKQMPPGSVFVDIAIDQGGMTEVSVPTTHDRPIYKYKGVNMYCVANIPAAVPMNATQAISNAVFPYLEKLASKGWKEAVLECPDLMEGVNMIGGHVTYRSIADQYRFDYMDPKKLM